MVESTIDSSMRVCNRNHNRFIFLWQSINCSMSVFRIDYGSCDTSSVKARFDQTWSFENKKKRVISCQARMKRQREKPRTIEKWFMFCVIHETMINRLLPFVPNIQMSLFIYLRSAFAVNNSVFGLFFKFSIAISIDNIYFHSFQKNCFNHNVIYDHFNRFWLPLEIGHLS